MILEFVRVSKKIPCVVPEDEVVLKTFVSSVTTLPAADAYTTPFVRFIEVIIYLASLLVSNLARKMITL
jgi:hypothetical protein